MKTNSILYRHTSRDTIKTNQIPLTIAILNDMRLPLIIRQSLTLKENWKQEIVAIVTL